MIRVVCQYLARRRLQRKIKAIKKNSYRAGVKAEQSMQEAAAALASFSEGLRAARKQISESEKEDTEDPIDE